VIVCAQFLLWRSPDERINFDEDVTLVNMDHAKDEYEEDDLDIKQDETKDNVNSIILDEASMIMVGEMFSPMDGEDY
jgi:hypothetical protein